MTGSVVGSIVMMRQRTSDLKRRFKERTEERRNKRRALRDEAELHKHSITRNSSDDSTISSKSNINMMNFAVASSTIASNCESHWTSHQHSTLYQRSSKREVTQVVHPVIYKRDIYLASRKEPNPARAVQKVVNNRGIMNDISNGPEEEAKTSLPAFSLTGSMLCRELEKGNIRANGTTANQDTVSPQRPLGMGLPAHTIMASMLFRTLEQEEKSTSNTTFSRNQYGVPTTIPEEVVSPANTSRSVVSELTMHSRGTEVDPNMVKASKNLLRILQANQFKEFDAKPRSSLYEA